MQHGAGVRLQMDDKASTLLKSRISTQNDGYRTYDTYGQIVSSTKDIQTSPYSEDSTEGNQRQPTPEEMQMLWEFWEELTPTHTVDVANHGPEYSGKILSVVKCENISTLRIVI